jgi:polyhydroxyalkanoate synthesis regulator phasin
MRLNMYYRLATSYSNLPSTLSKDAKVKINRIIEEDEEESKKQAIKERIERLTEAIQRLEEELTYLETGISPESLLEKAG